MSVPDSTGNQRSGSVKTLAIRLEADQHAQLSLIAQLRGSTLTEEIRSAIEAHLAAARSAPELTAQAESVLADIEREALARRAAIATLFGSGQQPETDAAVTPLAPAPPRGRSSGKPAGRQG
jgi:hypothetical protein